MRIQTQDAGQGLCWGNLETLPRILHLLCNIQMTGMYISKTKPYSKQNGVLTLPTHPPHTPPLKPFRRPVQHILILEGCKTRLLSIPMRIQNFIKIYQMGEYLRQFPYCHIFWTRYCLGQWNTALNPVSILYKSIAGRYRPVSYPDGPITAHYGFTKNASWVAWSWRYQSMWLAKNYLTIRNGSRVMPISANLPWTVGRKDGRTSRLQGPLRKPTFLWVVRGKDC